MSSRARMPASRRTRFPRRRPWPSPARPATASGASGRKRRLPGSPAFGGTRAPRSWGRGAPGGGGGGGRGGGGEVAALLSCYGLPVADQRVVTAPEEAGAAAREIGGDVALKAIAPGILHKTEVGGVRLNLRGADEVRAAAGGVAARLGALGHPPTGFVVQRMVPKGVEMLVGVVHDRQFGPVVACGAGGVLVELLRDVAGRLPPPTREDAGEMIRSLRTYPLLTGYRGGPVCDVRAL